MPPDLRTIGAAPFGDQQRVRLAAWLREAGWPRGHMGIVELEGYLSALIAWPIGIPTGAWLPPIWGGRGWRVPTKIAARLQFEEFITLTVGFLRELDRTLSQQGSRFESSVLRSLTDRARVPALQSWGKGFTQGLTLGSQGLKGRSETAVAAARTIATSTSASVPLGPRAVEHIVNALLALVAQRGSRGPLGPLELAPAVGVTGHSERSTPPDAARASR
jgi:yecA family protein